MRISLFLNITHNSDSGSIAVTYSGTGCATVGKQRALSREVSCYFRLYLKIGRTSVKRVERTEYSRATTIVYTQKYPIALSMVGKG